VVLLEDDWRSLGSGDWLELLVPAWVEFCVAAPLSAAGAED